MAFPCVLLTLYSSDLVLTAYIFTSCFSVRRVDTIILKRRWHIFKLGAHVQVERAEPVISGGRPLKLHGVCVLIGNRRKSVKIQLSHALRQESGPPKVLLFILITAEFR